MYGGRLYSTGPYMHHIQREVHRIWLGTWISGLLWRIVRAEKRRVLLSGEASDAKAVGLGGSNTETMAEI